MEEKTEICFGEFDGGRVIGAPDIDANVSQSNSTPETITGIAINIWKDIENSKILADDDENTDKLLKTLQQKYKDFAMTYPIILRFMVQMRIFNASVFKKFIIKHASKTSKTEEDFANNQIEYAIQMFKFNHPHYNNNELMKDRTYLTDLLDKERQEFNKIKEEIRLEMEKEEKKTNDKTKQELYLYLMRKKMEQQ